MDALGGRGRKRSIFWKAGSSAMVSNRGFSYFLICFSGGDDSFIHYCNSIKVQRARSLLTPKTQHIKVYLKI